MILLASLVIPFGGENITKESLFIFEERKPHAFDFSFIKKRNLLNTKIHLMGKLTIARDIKETLFKISSQKFNES